MGVQTPSSPSGKGTALITFKCCLPPSFGFPPKSFPLEREPTILGETFGARALLLPRTAPQRSRHVMPLAMRPLREESGALPAHFPSSATRLTLRVTIRWTFGSALTRSPPVAAPLRISARRVREWGRATTCKRGRMLAHGASLAERRVVPFLNEYKLKLSTLRISARGILGFFPVFE